MKKVGTYLVIFLLLFSFSLLAEEKKEDSAEDEKKTEENDQKSAEETSEEKKEETSVKKEESEKAEEQKDSEEKETSEDSKKEAEKADASENSKVDEAEPKVEVAVDESKKESASEEEEDENEDKEDSKRFSVGISNGFVHGINADRKNFAYSLTGTFSANLPWSMNASLSAGLSYSLQYDREVSTDEDPYNEDEESFYEFDGAPLSLTLSRGFKAPLEIKVAPSLTGVFFGTSKYAWEQELRAQVNAGVSFSRSFKVAKDLSLTIGWRPGFSYTFSEEDHVFDEFQNEPLYRINPWTISSGYSASLAYKGVRLRLGFSQQFSKSYDTDKFSQWDYVELQEWKQVLVFSASAGYSYRDFNFGLGFSTRGRDRKFGGYGDDWLYPGSPQFSTISANIGYNYSF